MNELNVRIVTLEPLRVAASLGFGPSPEELAIGRLIAWAGAQGLLDRLQEHRFFGFNNPNPSPGSPNYGYEQWMTVGEAAQPSDEVEIRTVPGGLYAVANFKGIPNPEKWQKLAAWLEDSPYQHAQHQWLEECLTPQLFLPGRMAALDEEGEFDLYLPIA